jgi:hypothetical protein
VKLVVHCAWLSLCLLACQSLTKLDELDVVATPATRVAGATAEAHLDGGAPPTAADADAPGSSQAMSESLESQCVIAEGAQCDLVRQCGCEQGEHCQTRTSQQRPTCVTPGELAPWSACHDARECPRGQTCDRGSCRAYCERNEDCEGGECVDAEGADSSSSDNIRVCWKRCALSKKDECARGTTCRSVETASGTKGTYCVAPFDPCPTTDDGHCDEAHNDDVATATCAEGSDRKDCECRPTLPGAPCDPLNQCGCARGLSCQVQALDKDLSEDNVSTLTAVCVKPGTKKLYEECVDGSECGLGLTCDLTTRLCVNYCYSKAQCKDGACKRMRNNDDLELGECTPRCSRSSGAPCVAGTRCATFAGSTAWSYFDEVGDYCWQPTSACPQNDVCDEPQGTGICVAGSDPQDCCGAPPGGECNHVTGCGCEGMPNTRCIVFFSSPMCLEGTETEAEPFSTCGPDTDSCPVGYGCHESVCRKYCATKADCNEEATCYMFLRSGRAVNGVGACFNRCDFDAENTCPEGQLCILRNAPNAYCGVPWENCPASYIGNGVCDDVRPGGTRICALGTDPDCDASAG